MFRSSINRSSRVEEEAGLYLRITARIIGGHDRVRDTGARIVTGNMRARARSASGQLAQSRVELTGGALQTYES